MLVLRRRLRAGLRTSSVLLMVEWVFLILCSTVIFRECGDCYRVNLIPFSSYFDIAENSYLKEAAAVNVLNVILFIPVGLLLGIGFKELTWKNVFVIGFGVSLSIELLQFFYKRGLCEIDDVIHNVVGCILGYTNYLLFKRMKGWVMDY